MRKFEAKIRDLTMATGNAQDGISTMQAIKSSFPQEEHCIEVLFFRAALYIDHFGAATLRVSLLTGTNSIPVSRKNSKKKVLYFC